MPAIRPGRTNSLSDVHGLRVGHHTRAEPGWLTGTTVVLTGDQGAVAGVDVRGGGPGTRETDLLDPTNLVDRVHAVVLSGGSAYGLAAADGVMDRLADAGIGFVVGGPGEVVPIVPAAVLFDLGRGGRFRATPDASFGAAAYDAAGSSTEQGSVGAGTGAVTGLGTPLGAVKGGIGSASAVLGSGPTVAALVAVNAVGSAVDPRTGELYGARFGLGEEFGDLAAPALERLESTPSAGKIFNTTIGVVATDAALTKAQCQRLATAGHDGIARALRPAHLMVDGDTLFGLATGHSGEHPLDPLLEAAADAVTRAIVHALLHATGAGGVPAYRERFGV